MSSRPLQRLIISIRTYNEVTRRSIQYAGFASTSHLTHLIRRSPTVKETERRRKTEPNQQQPPPPATPQANAIAWPVAIFDEAYKSNALPIISTQAVQLLDSFIALGTNPQKGDVERLCSSLNVKSSTLTFLARILPHSGSPSLKPHVSALVKAASDMGDATATLLLVSQALKTSNLRHPSVKRARDNLMKLVNANDPAALILLGKTYEAEKKKLKALQLFEKAASVTSDTTKGPQDGQTAEAWENIARIKLELADEDGAREATEKGALKYDDPQAYYLLAKKYRISTTPDYLPFMLKAAASGVAAAADQLGMYYLRQATGYLPLSSSMPTGTNAEAASSKGTQSYQSIGSKSSFAEHRTLAMSWFHIGASSNIPRSQVYYALFLREEGSYEESLEWLEKAAATPDWAIAVPWFQKQWYREDWKFEGLDVCAIQQGEGDMIL